ncbi:MAG: hypothetical protein IE909_04690 [Campylobacterales bacterium]|nr:hypothetical protein [Campylobacterales bacterium]
MLSVKQQSNYDKIPIHIATTLDEMAFGISQKESLDSYEVKQKMVNNLNKLSIPDFNYLVDQMGRLIDRSVNNDETIDENSVEKDFISFLIKLYY